MNPHFIAFWSKGTWTVKPKFPITFVTQDSRLATVGALYFALKGNHHDGHAFVKSAFDCGATAAVVSCDWIPPDDVEGLPLLQVDDPSQALLTFAAGWRNTLDCSVIGVTGSAGKTTVKELIAAILSIRGKTQYTPGNYNNEVGLPLSLLKVSRECEYAVIEAGISHPYDMYPLAFAMRPDVVVITSIGPAHMAFFGSEEAIATEKAQLLQALPSDGFAVIPKETHCFDILEELCPARIVTVSIEDASADYFGEPLAKGVVRVHHNNEPAEILNSGLSGAHNATNVLCAYAVARELGLTAGEALRGFANFHAPKMRWEMQHVRDMTFINDAYNANPLSMRAALETFAGIDLVKNKEQKVVCLGEMLELGDNAAVMHKQCGLVSGNGPWRLLIGVGELMKEFIIGAVEAGFPQDQTCWFEFVDDAAMELPLLVTNADIILLKGSRSTQMEKLIKPFEAV